jgi:hypothetical protein
MQYKDKIKKTKTDCIMQAWGNGILETPQRLLHKP